jgi:ATP adenylyltransferase
MKQLWAPWRLPYLQDNKQPSDRCVFCAKQTSDDSVEHILYRGEFSYVVLNRYPYNNGHILIVPYQHTGYIEEIPESTLLEMIKFLQTALNILRQVYLPEGFNIGINEGSSAGAGIAEHIHLHIVPRWAGDANYMTVIGETRIIPQSLNDTFESLQPLFISALKY